MYTSTAGVETSKQGEKPSFYNAVNVFYLKETARWSYIVKNASANDIAVILDQAMADIEDSNPPLKGALTLNLYASLGADKSKIKELIDSVNQIDENRFQEEDLIGRVYEYFLQIYAASGTKEDGEFYTPASVVKLIAEMIEPYSGTVYDPCCGSGGMFVQSMKFVDRHNGNIGSLQEAIVLYEQMPDGNKEIGFTLTGDSKSYELLSEGMVNHEAIDNNAHLKENPLVQKAVSEIEEYKASQATELTKEEEVAEIKPQVKSRTPVQKELGNDRKESVVQALRDRQQTHPPKENWQRYYENGEYVRNVEGSEEQNYSFVDGNKNNLKQSKLKSEKRPSVLKKLHEKQAEIARRNGKAVPQAMMEQEAERKRK